MMAPGLEIYDGPKELAVAAARHISRSSVAALGRSGRFTMALAGGSTPEGTYTRLACGAEAVDWSRTWLFFGDERWVASSDSRSNFAMVRRSLLTPASVPDDHVLAVPTSLGSAEACAAEYARAIERFFKTSPGGMPIFDLVLLGLGDDGHTASLFPGAAALAVANTAVTWSPPGTLPPLVDRITLTFPAINAAREVLFLVSGANKAEAFANVWLGRGTRNQRPALGVRPERGTLSWLVDRQAAGQIDSPH